ncbi:MAG: UDP-N-acetylmuramate dehydrogenase [Acidimicrobiia bacterium]|nr:MAG: UDP-N-acetylmuramate dehydrogenase [Acidimicrobiia bacterium]
MNETRHASVRDNVDLAPLTTYKLGGAAAWFADVEDRDSLREVLGSAGDVELLVLGRGSNLVVSDHGFPGLVLRLVGEFLVATINEDGSVSAGAGMPLPRLARFATEYDRGGLEFFVGIPGSVGGAIRMNAGGHGSDTATWLLDATILDRSTLTERSDNPADLELAYRHSNLGDADVVVAARFRTIEQAQSRGEQILRDVTRWRKQHQPGGTLNAGSVFKNPHGDAAGRIIDSLGLKGYRRGGVAVSDVHANFFVSEEGATAQDVWDLVWAIRSRVGERTGVWLEPELRFVGRFEGRPEVHS